VVVRGGDATFTGSPVNKGSVTLGGSGPMGDVRDQAIVVASQSMWDQLDGDYEADPNTGGWARFIEVALDAAHAAGLIRYTDELEEVGRLSLEGEFWPSDAGYFYADEPVFVVRDRNTEAGT